MELLIFAIFLPFIGDNESASGSSYLAFKHNADEVSPLDAEVACRRFGGRIPVVKKNHCGQQFQRLSLLSQQDITSFWTREEEGNYYRRLTVSKRSARQCHRYQRMFLQFNSNSYANELEIDDISYITVCVLSNTWVAVVSLVLMMLALLVSWITISCVKTKLSRMKYRRV